MIRLKIPLAAFAFLIATGVAFTGKAVISQGWYTPDYHGQVPSAQRPGICPDGIAVLCATHYNSNGVADGQLFKDH